MRSVSRAAIPVLVSILLAANPRLSDQDVPAGASPGVASTRDVDHAARSASHRYGPSVQKPAPVAAREELERGAEALKRNQSSAALDAFRRAIELDPTLFDAHHALFVNTISLEPAGLERAYASLKGVYRQATAKYPRHAVVWYFLGRAHEWDGGRADEYFSRALELDPTFVEALEALARSALMQGDDKRGAACWRRAADLKPGSPQFLYAYAEALAGADADGWSQEAHAVVERFPRTELAAKALFLLGKKAKTVPEKIRYLERARHEWPAAQSSLVENPTGPLFDLYARRDPGQALAFAREMIGQKVMSHISWQRVAAMQENIVRARALIDEGRASDALARLKATKPVSDVWSDELHLLAAEAERSLGQDAQAYERLAGLVAARPQEDLYNALISQGSRINRTQEQVKGDLRARREKRAEPAVDFELENYLDGSKIRLAQFRGQVVLLSFWHPG